MNGKIFSLVLPILFSTIFFTNLHAAELNSDWDLSEVTIEDVFGDLDGRAAYSDDSDYVDRQDSAEAFIEEISTNDDDISDVSPHTPLVYEAPLPASIAAKCPRFLPMNDHDLYRCSSPNCEEAFACFIDLCHHQQQDHIPHDDGDDDDQIEKRKKQPKKRKRDGLVEVSVEAPPSKRKKSSDSRFDEREFHCKVSNCYFATDREYNLRRHVSERHGGNKRILSFTCSCGQKTGSSTELAKHKRCHGANEIFACKFCDASFKILHRLKAHTKVHPEHEFQDLNEYYESLSALACEQRREKPKKVAPAKSFPCTHCDHVFARKDTREKHIQRKHTTELKKKAAGKFKCTDTKCGFSTSREADLKRHVQKLHGEPREFPCEICTASFGAKGERSKHTMMCH